MNLGDLGVFGEEAAFIEDGYYGTVEEAVSRPGKEYVNVFSVMGYFDGPEWFWDEIFHPEIAVHYKAESWELTGSCSIVRTTSENFGC